MLGHKHASAGNNCSHLPRLAAEAFRHSTVNYRDPFILWNVNDWTLIMSIREFLGLVVDRYEEVDQPEAGMRRSVAKALDALHSLRKHDCASGIGHYDAAELSQSILQ